VAYFSKAEVFAQEVARPEGKALIQQFQKAGLKLEHIKAQTDTALGFMSEKLSTFAKANASNAPLNKAWNKYIGSLTDTSPKGKANLGMKTADKGYFDFLAIDYDPEGATEDETVKTTAKSPTKAATKAAAKAPAKAPAKSSVMQEDGEEVGEDEFGPFIVKSAPKAAKVAAKPKAPKVAPKAAAKPKAATAKAAAKPKAAGKPVAISGPGRPPLDLEASLLKAAAQYARLKAMKAARIEAEEAAAAEEEAEEEAEEDEDEAEEDEAEDECEEEE